MPPRFINASKWSLFNAITLEYICVIEKTKSYEMLLLFSLPLYYESEGYQFQNHCVQDSLLGRKWSKVIKTPLISSEPELYLTWDKADLGLRNENKTNWKKMWCIVWFSTICRILKNVKNTHGGVLLLVKLQPEVCNFTKSDTPPWAFFTFLKLYK